MNEVAEKVGVSPRFCELGLAVIKAELEAVQALLTRVDKAFSQACEYMLACEGRVVVMGMGKSGHIANKIAATLASTGTPAFFLHPAEASHGDLGMLTAKDVVVALSNSGKTPEIVTILPLIKRLNVPLITLTGNPHSLMAKLATVNVDVSVTQEACPLGLAPTSSTTAALVMGDALAIALLEARGFTAQDFALAHPGGDIGRRLLLRVDDVMRTGDAIPKVSEETLLNAALIVMSQKGLGMTAVLNKQDKLVGIFTDGDLRRTMDHGKDIYTTMINQCMTRDCKTIRPGLLAVEALNLMETLQIMSLIVVNDYQQIVGVVHMHDLLRAGVV